nr:thioredoxin family protein [Nocardioides perillae]
MVEQGRQANPLIEQGRQARVETEQARQPTPLVEQARQGRVETPATPPPTSLLADTPYDAQRGERATLLQFSSAFCAPCRATRRVLGDIAEVVPGVTHVEVDAEQQLELVRRLGVLRTPTTVVLDRHGREVTRAAGAPRKEQVLTALAEAGLQ